MKKNFLVSIIFITLLIALCSIPSQAQTVNAKFDKGDGAALVYLPTTNVDSVTSTSTHVVTKWFDVSSYLNQNWTSVPVYYTKLYSSSDGKPYITTTLEFSNDQVNIWAADTLGGVKDSLETLYKGTISIYCNKAKYVRIKCVGENGASAGYKNRADATAYVDLLFTKP